MLKNTLSSQSRKKEKRGREGGRRYKCGAKTELHTTKGGDFYSH
jgi:hypothetical protein